MREGGFEKKIARSGPDTRKQFRKIKSEAKSSLSLLLEEERQTRKKWKNL